MPRARTPKTGEVRVTSDGVHGKVEVLCADGAWQPLHGVVALNLRMRPGEPATAYVKLDFVQVDKAVAALDPATYAVFDGALEQL